jgi:RNA polymerase sigma factor (sigma-70 family)
MTFEEFYKSTHKFIYNYLYLRLADKSQVEDLLQEVYIRFYYKNEKEAYTSDEIKLLFGFVKNIYKEYVKKSFKEHRVAFIENYDYSEFINESSRVESFTIEQRKTIVTALKSLRSKVRQVLEYRFFYGMTKKEVGAILNMKERDVLKYQQRGIKYLKRIVENSVNC